MDALDRALMMNWNKRRRPKLRVSRKGDRKDGALYLLEPKGGSTREIRAVPGLTKMLRKPLRSFCLVVRAGDLRAPGGCDGALWEDWCAAAGRPYTEPPKAPGGTKPREVSMEAMEFDARLVKSLCAPISIGYPGVPLTVACEMFGVRHGTVYRWEKRGLVHIRRMKKDPKHGQDLTWPCEKTKRLGKCALVTTNGLIDPGGEVWCGPWGDWRRAMVDRVPGDWGQWVWRYWSSAGRHGMWRWICPRCGGGAVKLYWPMPVMTVAKFFGDEPRGDMTGLGEFVCRGCAGFMYDSEEMNPGYEAHEDKVWDWFVRRLTEGRMRGSDLVLTGEG